jgi:hypothetical protein
MTKSNSTLNRFCRQVRQRSEEHQQAFQILRTQNLWGAALSLVRQELDSMIRVIYLLEIEEPIERNRLMKIPSMGNTGNDKRKKVNGSE